MRARLGHERVTREPLVVLTMSKTDAEAVVALAGFLGTARRATALLGLSVMIQRMATEIIEAMRRQGGWEKRVNGKAKRG